MQKYWDSQAAPVCVMQKTHGEEPSSWFISVIFQCMKKGLRPNGYFPLTRQPHLLARPLSDPIRHKSGRKETMNGSNISVGNFQYGKSRLRQQFLRGL